VSALIRYLTLDSQPLVHGGVRHLLRSFADLKPVGEAFDLADALRAGLRCTPDIALVEIEDLGPDWGAGLHRLAAALPGAHLVVLSGSVDASRAREALRAGVRGYLLKRVQPLMLAQALRSVAAGQQVLAPEVAEALVAGCDDERPSSDEFSQREREVLAWLARGLSNDAIADRLCISLSTVKFHLSNIFEKLGVTSRSQAVVAAFEHGLVPRFVARGAQQALPDEHRRPVAVARRA
jgi:NarL family two-component system response regulator LiaR